MVRRAFALAGVALILSTSAVFASSADVAVVDTTSPFGSVTISPGGSGNITINLAVTGAQAGTATFEVNRDWVLTGGVFIGSNPQEFTVGPRAGGDPPTTFSTSGTVSVDSLQAGGTFTLAVSVFDITNSNQTGGKLAAGQTNSYDVTVPSDPCVGVSAPGAPVISPNPTTADGSGGWFKTIPVISATTSTVGATIQYASEANGGAKSAYSTTPPVLGQGTTIVYARATSATCSKTSESTATYMVDSVAPVVSVTPDRLPNAGGWYNAPVTFDTSATDLTSGVLDTNCTADQPYSSPETTSTTVSGSCTDNAGNQASASSATFGYDSILPVVSVTPDRLPNAGGWYNAPVTFDTSATDATSGVLDSSCTADQTYSAPDTTSTTVPGSCTDNAGNQASASSATFGYDSTAPVVSVTGVAQGGSYSLGSVPAASCSTSDATSGVATQATIAVTGGTPNGVGTFTATCSGGTDNAGNSQGSAAVQYQVVYTGLTGILQPINPDNTSVFSRGKSVPVKFQLLGDEYTGFATTGWVIQKQSVACGVFDGQDAVLEAVTSNTPSTIFRYDATADQYIYNADMRSQAVGTCWNFKVTLDSGQVLYSAVFKLNK
jgi:hypothetical protein